MNNSIRKRLQELEERIKPKVSPIVIVKKVQCGRWQIMGNENLHDSLESASTASGARVTVCLTRGIK